MSTKKGIYFGNPKMTYPSRVEAIHMYGGALLIVLGIVCVFSVILLTVRWHRLITKGTRTIEYIGNSMLIPLLSIVGLFRDSTKKSK